jgi:AcrR family transcriptional regulator
MAAPADRHHVARVGVGAPPEGRDATRDALRQAAHDLLATEGPGALTVRRLAAAAGMSTMNIYSRFGGKDGVVEELYLAGFRALAEQMEGDGASGDPMSDLEACGRAYRTFALQNPTYYSVMFDRTIPGFEPSDDARAAALGTLEALAHKLERAMDAGLLQRHDPLQVAVSVWSTCHGLMSLELKDVAPPGIDWEGAYTRTLAALLAGLA